MNGTIRKHYDVIEKIQIFKPPTRIHIKFPNIQRSYVFDISIELLGVETTPSTLEADIIM